MNEVKRPARFKANLVDRVVSYLSPAQGIRRLAARAMLETVSGGGINGGYLSGKSGRRFTNTWNPGGGDGNRDLIWDLHLLRERSRDACRNIPIALGVVNTAITYTIGRGLYHHARPYWKLLPKMSEDAQAAWQDDVEAKFMAWCTSKFCDVEERRNFFQLQRLVKRSQLESGDVFVIQTARKSPNTKYALALQVIEADRCSNPFYQANSPTLMEGCEIETNGKPKTFWISEFHPGALVPTMPRVWDGYDPQGPFGRKNILQLAELLRPGQVRGVPILAPFLEQIKQVDEYRDAEQKAAIIASWFTVLLETQNAEGVGGTTGIVSSAGNQGDGDAANPKLGPGIIASMRTGDKAIIVNPGRPNVNFGPYIQSNVEQLGMGVEIPYEVLLKHYDSSYSASRAAQQECWRAFQPKRDDFTTDFSHEVYCAWLTEAVAIGDVRAPGYLEDPDVRRAWQGDEWTGDAPISMDPLAEAQAVTERLANGTSDLATEIAALSGKDVNDVVRQRSKERDLLIAAGLYQAVAQVNATDKPVPPSKQPPDQKQQKPPPPQEPPA